MARDAKDQRLMLTYQTGERRFVARFCPAESCFDLGVYFQTVPSFIN